LAAARCADHAMLCYRLPCRYYAMLLRAMRCYAFILFATRCSPPPYTIRLLSALLMRCADIAAAMLTLLTLITPMNCHYALPMLTLLMIRYGYDAAIRASYADMTHNCCYYFCQRHALFIFMPCHAATIFRYAYASAPLSP